MKHARWHPRRGDRSSRLSRERQKLRPRVHHLSDDFAKSRQVFQICNALPGEDHVGERTGHGEAAIVHGFVEQ